MLLVAIFSSLHNQYRGAFRARLLEPERYFLSNIYMYFYCCSIIKGFVANVDRFHFVYDFARTLYHAAIYFGPLKNVLLTHNVRVDEQVTISDTEVFLAGSAFEAFKVIDFVTNTHGHFESPDPLFTRSTESVLTKQSEVVSPAQLSAEFVVKPASHLP